MSLKEKFENHPLIFGGTLLISGFVAGFSVRLYVPYGLPETKTVVQEVVKYKQPVYDCRLPSLELLQKEHEQRLNKFHDKLLELETKASDDNLIRSYQQTYLAGAERIRTDIETEKSDFKSLIERIEVKCQERA
ncbi:hypothetical protein OPW07_25575 [Vibrio europaeus]|uniref:hypothetical protein n=1 Tax=Vibrio europaeus TaxID=300876 RepID=UPI0018A74673|nr:hypothetical protein [Vibrio europaeus]MDC5813091.1 hypothetical protein [Vibrio europaeus]QPG34112.1 hypothetical protein IXK98_08350 [Vibrio europaeus]